MLLLYVRQPLYSEVRDLATQYFRSGTFWVATTKGGIVARFTLHGRRFVFCGMHLSPHPENVEVRHQEYEQSLATLQELVELGQRGDELDLYLPPGHWLWGLVDRDPEDPDAGDELPAPTDTLQTHSGLGDYFLFAGDLNYRVDLPYADAVESVRAGDLAPLLAKDQLKVRACAGTAHALPPSPSAPLQCLRPGHHRVGRASAHQGSFSQISTAGGGGGPPPPTP